MFFLRPKADARSRDWQALAQRLDLEDASGSEALLRELLDPPAGVRLAPMYACTIDPELTLYLTECREGGRVPTLTSVILLSAGAPIASVGLRASRRRDPVLESLGASASGGQPVRVPGDAAFNERVSVLARDPAAALVILTPPLRRRLQAALYNHQVAPTFLLSERQLALTVRRPAADPADPAQLEGLTVALLGICAALLALR